MNLHPAEIALTTLVTAIKNKEAAQTRLNETTAKLAEANVALRDARQAAREYVQEPGPNAA